MCCLEYYYTSSFYSCEKLSIKTCRHACNHQQLFVTTDPSLLLAVPASQYVRRPYNTQPQHTPDLALTLPSSFPVCPHTRPCPFRLRCPFMLSLGLLHFKAPRSIAQQPFGLHAAQPRNLSLSLGSACVVFGFLRPRLAPCFFCAGTAAAAAANEHSRSSPRLGALGLPPTSRLLHTLFRGGLTM